MGGRHGGAAWGTIPSVRASRRNRNLWLLQTSWACFVTTDLALLVLLSVVGYSLGGVEAVGLVAAARVLPGALLAPVIAPVADRVRRQALLAFLHGAWAVGSLGLAAAAGAGSLAALVLVAAIGSLGASLFRGGFRALLAQVVVSPTELVCANAAYAAIEGVGTAVGPAGAGALLVLLQPQVALAVLAVVFVAGAVSTGLVRTAFQAPRRSRGVRRADVLRGWSALTGPDLRVTFGLLMSQCLMRGLLTVFVVALCLRQGGGGETRVAALFSALGVGGLLGALVASRLPGQRTTARRMALGVALWGLPVALLGLAPGSVGPWLAMAAVGVGNAMEDVYGLSVVDRLLPDHLAARAWTTFWSVAAAMVTGGSLLGPRLVVWLGLRSSMVLTGAVLLTLALVAMLPLRRVDAVVGEQPDHLDLVRGVAELAPLPSMSLERLARALRPRDVEDGEFVMEEGAAADAFALVADGTLEVRQGGAVLRRLHRGDGFGEIGLLMGRPRTASVIAVGRASVLWLDAEAFVSAVTGHRVASAAGLRVAASHLAADRDRRSGS